MDSLRRLIVILIHAQLLINTIETKGNDNNLVQLRKCSSSELPANSVEIPKEFFSNKKYRNLTENVLFSLDLKDAECKTKLMTFSIHLHLETENDTKNTRFKLDGFLKYNFTNFGPNEYCIQSKSDEEISIKYCKPEECSAENPCIRKCCEIDEVWDLSTFEEKGNIYCRPSGNKQWSPTLYKDRYTKLSKNELKSLNPRYFSRHPKAWCDGDFSLMTLRKFAQQEILPFRVLQNGSVIQKTSRRQWDIISDSKICVDGAQNFPLASGLSGLYSGDEEDTVVLDCRGFFFENDEDPSNETKESKGLYITALFIAIIFLALTITAHLILWKKQNIHGWTLMGYVTSLFVQFIFLILGRVIAERGHLCTFVAIGTHFACLSTFSWLTTMNFDVFWNFRTMNPSVQKSEQIKMFIAYASFAAALPITIVSVALILNKIYSDPFSEVIIPEYGEQKCGLDNSAEFVYLFGPISVLLACNLVFLFTTLYYIYKNQKILKSSGLKTKLLNDKTQFFGMLFLIAGITWIFDVISWATTDQNRPTPWYWILTDFINILQAIAIFVIFVCNPKQLKSLQQQIPCLSKLMWTPKCSSQTAAEDARKMSLTQVCSITDCNNGKSNFELK